MEDRHVVLHEAGGLFGGVYDGHGGAETADLVAESLHRAFLAAIANGRSAEEAFRYAYDLVDREALSATSGATAVAFFLAGRHLVVANVGDGRAVIVRKSDHRLLTRDHRLDDAEERRRIIEAGGEIEGPYVIRSGAGLMVTRSLGDTMFRPAGVIPSPDVISYSVTLDDLCLVVGCDGLWDVLSTAEVAQMARPVSSAQAVADILARAVRARHGRDNVTVLTAGLAVTPA